MTSCFIASASLAVLLPSTCAEAILAAADRHPGSVHKTF